MAGVEALRKIQMGPETTKGTAVAATFMWRGLGVIKDQEEVIFPAEHVGILGGSERAYISRYWGELSMPEVEATFEQLPHLFEAGIATEVPTTDGLGTSCFIYNYLAPTTTQNTTTTYTIEGGDDNQAEEFDYGFVKSFKLTGEGQGALMMSAEWFGRQVTNTDFTALTTPPVVEEILVNSGVLYIDTTTVGTTTVSDTLFGIDLDWTTGLQEYWAVDGSKDFSIIKQKGDEIVVTLTYEHNSDAVAEKGEWRDGTIRFIRLKFEGSDTLSTGTTYTKKTLLIDMAGKYEDFSVLGSRDGNDVLEAKFRCRYAVNATNPLKADVTVVNGTKPLA